MSDLSEEHKKECERIFEHLDTRKENNIDINKVLLGLGALGKICTLKEQKEIENKYGFYDLNNFLNICSEKVDFNNLDSNLISYFRILEKKDKPGYISIQNLKFILKKFDEKITDKEINEIVREVGDVEEGNVNIEQLVKEFLKN